MVSGLTTVYLTVGPGGELAATVVDDSEQAAAVREEAENAGHVVVVVPALYDYRKTPTEAPGG